VSSAPDVSEGGLAVALAECCISHPEVPLGAVVELPASMRVDALLFGESQSRILLSLKRRHLGRLRDLAQQAGIPCAVLGEVRGRRLVVSPWIDIECATLRQVWENALPRRMESPAVNGGKNAQ
jgi:phosphoribosylformylglycinamidine synthase